MNEFLSMAEIEKRYPDEWVLIDQPNTNEHHEVLAGTVVYHGPDREEAYRPALTLPVPRWFAVRCTGELCPVGTEFML